VRSPQGIIPVEVKSGLAPDSPYAAHILQLAAYCLLVEEQEGKAPPYGILKYQDRAFEIEYSADLRNRLLSALQAMRQGLRAGELDRDHQQAARCQGCGYRAQCGQSLV
jgi:CRISPR-associated exonuclease Cas4